jgi:hypothetical protein
MGWHDRRPGDIKGILLMVGIFAAIVIAMVFFSRARQE